MLLRPLVDRSLHGNLPVALGLPVLVDTVAALGTKFFGPFVSLEVVIPNSPGVALVAVIARSWCSSRGLIAGRSIASLGLIGADSSGRQRQISGDKQYKEQSDQECS